MTQAQKPLLTSPDGTPASRFAFGAMQFGGTADAKASAALFDACRAAGITHFDTAYSYTDGASETLLAPMIQAERDSLLIATKGGYIGGASAANMRAQVEVCRSRLQLDVIDIFYLHHSTPDTDLRDTMEGFAQMKEDGVIRYVGLSNLAAWQVMKAQAYAHEMGITVDILQPMYNLVKRQAEVEILPMCADQGIAIAPYSPLGGGLLTGKYVGDSTGRIREDDRYASRYGPDWMHQTAMDLAALGQEIGVSPATLAAAWVARHPGGPMPILSARNTDQLAPSLAAMTFEMSDALYARISALSPTPPPATDRLEEQG